MSPLKLGQIYFSRQTKNNQKIIWRNPTSEILQKSGDILQIYNIFQNICKIFEDISQTFYRFDLPLKCL